MHFCCIPNKLVSYFSSSFAACEYSEIAATASTAFSEKGKIYFDCVDLVEVSEQFDYRDFLSW